MTMQAKEKQRSGFPSLGVIYDRAGMPVDASDWQWTLNDLTGRIKIDWTNFNIRSPAILESAVNYIGHMVETQGTESVRNAFFRMSKVVSASNEIQMADLHDAVVPFECFGELRRVLGPSAWLIHDFRQWYCWAADHGYENFSPDVAFECERLRIGGNEKGQAVLSLDPEVGPLDDVEIASLLNALRAASKDGRLSLAEQAAVWLCVALGPNPIQIALMREEDVKIIEGKDGEQEFIQIDVPRMKKGDACRRDEFRRRQVTREIGTILLALKEENRRLRDSREWESDFAYPLFVRKRATHLADGPMREYAMHLTAPEFTRLLSGATQKLSVISHRTTQPLSVTTRRLRYTYATRLVKEGVSKREIADLLDHTDLQNVQVYFDIKSDIVEPLDAAMALALGPIAQAFLGKVVRSEIEAARGDDPSSQIAVFDPDRNVMCPAGNCGNFGFCNLLAPVACYTCGLFQPWMDAPHHVFLNSLLADRERKRAAGRDGRMIAIYDDTILAIADVIARIEAMKGGMQ